MKAKVQSPNDEWEQYLDKESSRSQEKPRQQIDKKSQLELLKKQYPLMYKIAENLQGSPALEKAGNIAGRFNKAVEGTGLPSLAKGFFLTGIEMGRGIANLIPGVNIPQQQYNKLHVNPYVREGAETIGSLGMALPAYRGYQAAKRGIEALPYAKKIPELIRNVLAGGVAGSAVSPDHRGLGAAVGGAVELAPFAISGAKNWIQGRNPIGRERDLYKAMMEHEMQKADLDTLKNISMHKFGKNNPEALLLSAQDKAAKLEEAEAFKRRHFPDEKMLPGHQLIPEAEYGVKNVNEVLKQTLGEGEPHSQELSKHIVNAIEGVPTTVPHPKTGLPMETRVGGARNAWGAKMDELENSLPEVSIPSTDIRAVESDFRSFFQRGSTATDAEKENFRRILSAAHTTHDTMSGRQFFRAYRSLRRLEGQERSKAFGLGPREHDEWIARANATKKSYEDMEKIINKNFPEETMKRLHELNHEYSTKIAPLHENPMYQQMLHHGRYKGNIVEALSGTTRGNKILNNLIQNDPNLSRLVLGHSFAEHPEKLMKPNKNIEPFVRANPNIAQLMTYQKEAASALEESKRNAELYKHVEKIPALRKEIHEQSMLAKRLRQETELAGLTKTEVAKKKIEYDKSQKKLRALINKLIGASIVGTGVGYVTKKVRE